jgi:hypothetical protein
MPDVCSGHTADVPDRSLTPALRPVRSLALARAALSSTEVVANHPLDALRRRPWGRITRAAVRGNSSRADRQPKCSPVSRPVGRPVSRPISRPPMTGRVKRTRTACTRVVLPRPVGTPTKGGGHRIRRSPSAEVCAMVLSGVPNTVRAGPFFTDVRTNRHREGLVVSAVGCGVVSGVESRNDHRCCPKAAAPAEGLAGKCQPDKGGTEKKTKRRGS